MPEPNSRLTLGVIAFQETLDGTSKSRILSREISLFYDGIKNIGHDTSPKYLVYAGPSASGTKAQELGLYWIRTRSGVLRLGDDGSLPENAGMPFVEMWRSDDEGNFDWRPAYDLQDARNAAQLAIQGIADTSGVPEEQSTGIEEEPADQTADSSEQGNDALGGESSDVQGADDGSEASDDSEAPTPGTAGDVSEQNNNGEASSPETDNSNVGDDSSDDSESLEKVGDNDDASEQGDNTESGESGDAQESGDGSEVLDDGEVPGPGVGGNVPEQEAPVEDAKPDTDAGDGQADDKGSVVPEEDNEAAEQTESGKDTVPGNEDDPDDTDNGDNSEDSQDTQESSDLGS